MVSDIGRGLREAMIAGVIIALVVGVVIGAGGFMACQYITKKVDVDVHWRESKPGAALGEE